MEPDLTGLPQAPLSRSQAGLWYLNQLEPDNSAYHNVLLVRFEGRLDVPVLRSSIDEIVRRHEALRTRLAVVNGVPTQFAVPELDVPLPVSDVPVAPGTDPFAQAIRLSADETAGPFDLASGPAIRLRLLRMDDLDHLLVVTVHHVVCDGTGITIFMRELMALYTAFAQGRPSPLEELPAGYIETARRQHERLSDERLSEGIAYWERRLAGAPPLLELPLDRPRPVVQSHRGAMHRETVPPGLTTRLREFARREGVTPFMVVLAALQAVLHRYSGQSDVLVGTMLTGRTRRELRGMVAYLANTIVLRATFDPKLTVRGLLHQVRETRNGAFRHSDVPFERVVQALRPPRNRGYHPVFQVVLAYNERGAGSLDTARLTIPELTVSFPKPRVQTARVDLSLCLAEHDDTLGLEFEYSSDLFDEATVRRLAGHFQVLLAGMVSAPEAVVDELPLLTEDEHELLTRHWARGEPVTRSELRLHELFEAQAAAAPGADAVIHGWRRMSYGELDRRANQLAHRLRALGARPGRLVGVCMRRCPELVVALLGVLKSGAGYVFVEPGIPAQRRAFMLRDSGVRIVVAHEPTLDTVPEAQASDVPDPAALNTATPDTAARDAVALIIVALDLDRDLLDALPPGKPRELATPQDLTYCIYTSGSTGQPKAVGIRHEGAVAFAHWAASVFSPHDLAGVLACASPMFDCTLFEMFVPLSCGGTTVLADSLLGLPELDGPTPVRMLLAAPTVIAELLGTGGLPASVRTIVLSGEAVPSALPAQLYAAPGVERVYNFFGISETTTLSVGALLPRPDGAEPAEHGADPVVGRPIPGTSVYLLDGRLSPVPVGVVGEFYLGGTGVARGYLGRPALTAQRFLPDPFDDRPGARMYRTGDLGRWRATGDAEVVGRGDRQVKLRGFRIELGEVESALGLCPGVQDAAVELVSEAGSGRRGRKRLVAYLVGTEPDSGLSAAELRAHLRERLPEHCVPAQFVTMPSLPMTANGKVDRAALALLTPEPAPAAGPEQDLWRLAEAIEVQVQLVWNELLDVKAIDARESFFDVGGDSLLAVVMLTRVRDTFGVHVPVGEFMAEPTIEGLSRAVRGGGWRMPGSCLVRVSGADETQRPLFVVHPGGGELYELRNLRHELGDRPVYALMPIGWNGEAEPLSSIEEMAARYIEEIRGVQPRGPYLLGGLSLGGLIAFEIAQQLVAAGEHTSFLGLLETWPVFDGVVCVPEDAPEYESTARAVREAASTGRVVIPAQELSYMKRLSWTIPALDDLQRALENRNVYDYDGLCRELDAMRPKLQQALDQLKERGLVVDELDMAEFFRMHEVAAKQMWAKSAYRARHYPGKAVLFASKTMDTPMLRRLWTPLVDELAVEQLDDVVHTELLHDPLLARAVRRRLEEAEALVGAAR